jgi:Leucine-rich repeat (LRR) protein
VLVVLLAVLVLANVPGQIVRSPSLSEGWHEGFEFMLEDELQHGWPATYLWREPSGLPIPWAMPPAGWRSLWPLSENVKRWNLASLALDVFVGLAVLALSSAGYEAWRRRRVKLGQFHLSDLLALVAVASVVLGYWKIHADEYRSQHEALVAIQDKSYENDWQPGGPSWLRLLLEDRRFHILDRVIRITVHTNEPVQLQYMARLPYLKRIESASEEILPYLRYHPQLEVLKLDMRDAEHGQWAALRQVPNLRALKLAETGITDADLIHLADLKRLQYLNLSDNAITDQGLVHLAGLTGLETLSLAGTKVTDAGLVHLKNLAKLRDLSLNYLVTPTGVEQLAALPNLERLWLPSKIDGDAIRHFRHFRKLQYIEIKDPELTDEQLTPLAEMIGLESLTIEGDRFTGRGLVALRSSWRASEAPGDLAQVASAHRRVPRPSGAVGPPGIPDHPGGPNHRQRA